jgi:glycosyltransferase involved in cell wall biosynthesis
VAEGADVTLVTERLGPPHPGVRQVTYSVDPPITSSPTLAATDYHVRTGEAVAAELGRLRDRDPPDAIIGHIGWGGLLFAKDTLPGTPLIGYCEYYYKGAGSDLDFDPAFTVSAAERRRIRMRNAAQLVTLETLDAAYAPTRWQQQQYPRHLRQRIAVCHDGIDVTLCRPDPRASFSLPDGRVLKHGDPVVTYVSRDLDPYRGYPQFMRAARLVARSHPGALFVTVGGDGPGYGRPRPDGRLWREVMQDEADLGARLVHIPWLDHAELIRLFQVSAAHVYLSVPFVLSWSLLEAMACGCLVIGSRTAPVQEVITDRSNGILTSFHDETALADAILDGLARPDSFAALGQAARATVMATYRRETCVDRQFGLLASVMADSDLALA